MWQLSFILIGLAVGYDYGIDVETRVGEDVNLRCLGTSKNDPIFSINWKQSDGTPYFNCDEPTIPCEENTTKHSLGVEGDTFISILTMRNVSLIHEDEYLFTMLSPEERRSCKINLTVNVPPTGLILIDKDDGILLPNNGLLIVPEGGNKTIGCKTSTSVKPAVELKWVIPEGLNVITEYGAQIQDEQDERLLLPTRTLSFTPNYTFNEDMSIFCKVVTDLSFEYIKTATWIKKKEHPVEEQRLTGIDLTPWLAIAGSSIVVIVLFVLGIVGGIIRWKMAAESEDATQCRPSESGDALPPPPSDQSSSQSFSPSNHLPNRHPFRARSFRPAPFIPSNALDTDNQRLERTCSPEAGTSFTHSPKILPEMDYAMINDKDYAFVSDSPNGASGPPPQSLDVNIDRPDNTNEMPHTYMAMEPISQCRSTARIRKNLLGAGNDVGPSTSEDDRTLYVSPTPLRKVMKADSDIQEGPTYVNTREEDGISKGHPNILHGRLDSLDGFFTTYL